MYNLFWKDLMLHICSITMKSIHLSTRLKNQFRYMCK